MSDALLELIAGVNPNRRWHRKGGTYMLHVDRAVGQFQMRLASVIAAKGGRVEHCIQQFNITALTLPAGRMPARQTPSAEATARAQCHPRQTSRSIDNNNNNNNNNNTENL